MTKFVYDDSCLDGTDISIEERRKLRVKAERAQPSTAGYSKKKGGTNPR